jgi:twitching motility protein PilT
MDAAAKQPVGKAETPTGGKAQKVEGEKPSPDGGGAAVEQSGRENASGRSGVKLLEQVVWLVHEKGATDIHWLEGQRPRIRVRGDLVPVESKTHPVVTRQDIQDVLDSALTEKQKEKFKEQHDIDFSLDFKEATGRVNVGLANGGRLHLALRYLRDQFIPLEKLGIAPEMLKAMIADESGLILVTGETSSGKTTTIIAMLDYINHSQYGAITTIENPVEYRLTSDKCLISRREVGRDTPNFHSALRASVRKNPDVLLIGEIRDAETANTAMHAAETGIQTFCTLHARGAVPAISRLGYIMIGGGHDEDEYYSRLANTLRGIVSQHLVKAADSKGVLPIYEILNISYAEKDYLRNKDYPRLEQSLESERNISLGHCVYHLWHEDPRRIDESTVRHVFGDQFKLAMHRLEDKTGWRPLAGSVA